MRNEETPIRYIYDSQPTDPNSFFTKAATRFLVLTIPGSYKYNIARVMEQAYITSYLPIREIKIVNK